MGDLAPKAHRRLEWLVVATLYPALALSASGVALASSGVGALGPAAVGLLAAGLLSAAAAVAASHPISHLRSLGARFSGGMTYDRQRHWNHLKTASLLLHGLAVGGAVTFLAALLVRLGWIQARLELAVLDRGALVLVLALASTQVLAHHYALRFPTTRDQGGTRLVLSLLGQVVAFMAGLLAFLVLVRGEAASPVSGIDASAAPMLLLGGHVFAAYALFASRGLPTFSILFNEERDTFEGGDLHVSRGRLFAPVFLAFGLLMLVFLLFVLLGVGVFDVLTEMAASPILLGSLVFLGAVVVLSLGAAFSLARDQDREVVLWQTPQNPRERIQRTILVSGLAVAGTLAMVAFLTAQGRMPGAEPGLWVQFFCFSLMAAIGPYGFYMAREHKRVRQLEERFPDFLRDIASSHKGGLTLSESVRVASRGEYGPLTAEVRKMAAQLSWNVPFQEALVRFGDRVQTPLVERAVTLVEEADRSGGSTTDVLLAAARDAREIKNLENERRMSMGLYTVVIYITFFVFLAVAAVLYAQFVPEIVSSSQSAAEIGAHGISGVGGETLRLDQFQRFYFLAAVMQGLGDGIVAGMMGSGRMVLGLRHAFLMVLVSYLTFTLFLV